MTPLDDTTRSIVTSCIPALEQHGVAIADALYRRLLADPETRRLFNLTHQEDGSQPRALASALVAYARHIGDPAVLGPTIERIAEKHVGLTVRPEHYAILAPILLGAIGEVLGAAATPEVLDAWARAYWALANVLIAREREIADCHAAAPGGWEGWRRFVIRARTAESTDVMSFILAPEDAKPVMRHLPGQFLSFRFAVPGHDTQSRTYSISSVPNDETYRISVRRLPGGLVSTWLHDTAREGTVLDVSAPAGDFILTDPGGSQVTFIGAGIGSTPLVCMMDTLATCPLRPLLHYIHVDHTVARDAFAEHIRRETGQGQITTDLFYTRAATDAAASGPGLRIHAGRPTAAWLGTACDPQGTFYLCGPADFMIEMRKALRDMSVPPIRIRYEYFGAEITPS